MNMMKIMVTAALVQATVTTATADNFRCPNGAIVSEGARLAEVRTKCDSPTFIDKRSEPAGTFGSGAIEVEEWTYDGGPNTFIYYLTFTNGVLTKIISGDYGTRKKQNQ